MGQVTRTWTAKTGHTIDGEFVSRVGDAVSIKLPNGTSISIDINQLSDADKEFVINATKPPQTGGQTGGPAGNGSAFVVVDPPTPPPSVFVVVASQTFGFNTPRNVLEQEAQKGNLEALYYLARGYENGWNGCPKDEQKADELYQRGSQQADTGNPFAQYCRAVCYMEGIGVPKDEAEAVKWYRKAAEQGNAAGQTGLGTCYVQGTGVPKDVAEAVKWFRKAAEQGDATGQANLARCYEEGIGVPEDIAEAIKWYLKSAEQGFLPAQFMLGFRYASGQGVPKDEEEAKKWLRKAAGQGFELAISMLSELEGGEPEGAAGLFMRGMSLVEGEDANLEEAAKCFLKSAELGFPPAQYMIGICYDSGEGVRQDEAEAAGWFRKAAEQGFPPAQFSLGKCYVHGNGLPADKEEGLKWLRKSAEQGFEQAIEMLRQLDLDGPDKPDELGEAEALFQRGMSHREGNGVPQNQEEAAKYFRQSAELGYVPAQFYLGVCYDNGQGVRQDKPEAVKWYLQAAEQGFEPAQYNLGITYYIGDGIPVDEEEGIRWIRKAAEQDFEPALNYLQTIGEGIADVHFVELKGHTDDVWIALFSPDGKKIVTTSPDGTIRIWDAELGSATFGKELHKLEPGFACRGFLFSPDSERFITSDEDIAENMEVNTVQIWDVESGRELRKQVLGAGTSASDNLKKVIALSSTNRSNQNEGLYEIIQVWDVDLRRLLTLRPRGAAIAGTNFALPGWYPGLQTEISPDGTRIVSVRLDTRNDNSIVQVWDGNTGRELRTLGAAPTIGPLRQQPDVVKTFLFSPDGSLVATHGLYVKIWDVQSGRELQSLYGYTGAFSPDGTKIATAGLVDKGGGTNYTVYIWDVRTGRQLSTLGIEGELVENVLFSPDSKTIAAQCSGNENEEGPIAVFDVQSGRKLLDLEDFPTCFSPDSKTMVIERFLDDVSVTQLLDAESGKKLQQLKGSFGGFSPDGKKIATINGDTTLVWDLSGTSVPPVPQNSVPQQTGTQTHSDREYGFGFAYPGDWSVVPDVAGMRVAIKGKSDDGFFPNMIVKILPPNEDILKTMGDDLRKAFAEDGFPDLEYMDYGNGFFSGKEYFACHIRGTMGEGPAKGLPLEQEHYWFPHKDKIIYVTFCCLQTHYDKYRPLFRSIRDSFQFDGNTPQPPSDEDDDGVDPIAIEKLRQAAEQGDEQAVNVLRQLEKQ